MSAFAPGASRTIAPHAPLDTARDLVRAMPERFRIDHRAAPTYEAAGGRGAAVLLQPQPFEAEAPHASDAHNLCFFVKGEAQHRLWLDGRPVIDGPVRPGLLMMVKAGAMPRVVTRAPLVVLHVYLPHRELVRKAQLAGWGGRDGQLEIIDSLTQTDAALDRLCRVAVDALGGAEPFAGPFLDHLVDAIGVRVLQRWSNLDGAPFGPTRGGLSPTQLHRACEAMDARLGEPLDLKTLADEIGCSPSHFSRAFKRSIGMPPFEWLLRRRIDRAKALLCTSDLPLVDVALSVGFAAQPQFTTAFRRVTGVTPGAWRRAR